MKMRWWVAVCVAALVATFNCSIAYAQDRDPEVPSAPGVSIVIVSDQDLDCFHVGSPFMLLGDLGWGL